MAQQPQNTIDTTSGFSKETTTFYSLRTPTPLPPPNQPLSITQYTFSLLNSNFSSNYVNHPSNATFLIDSTAIRSLTYSDFLNQTHSLSRSLHALRIFNQNDVAFILSPPSLTIPVLYFSLLSLGVTVSPSNPLASNSEITHQIQLSRPRLAFATSQTAPKLPSSFPTILLDSPEFLSLLTLHPNPTPFDQVTVSQSDVAAILYSSGTTGKVKGVSLTHRNLIALTSENFHNNSSSSSSSSKRQAVFFTVPMFHVFGFFMLVTVAALGKTVVFMERFDFEKMLAAVERYRVTYMPVSPPLVVGLIKSELTKKFDLSSLEKLGCGGAPLGKEVIDSFIVRFPNIQLTQGYGLTESTGGATRMLDAEEAKQHDSVGRLSENMEAKIVDPETGEALPPGQKGELWLRGPIVMKGYVHDDKATAETLDSEGWLKTGDLCYFDSRGFLHIVDRLKELIKYNAYQVPPAELEQLLQSNPEIADAAVIPYPDEGAGQIPMAFVVRKPGSHITDTQVMDYIAKQVAPYKKIRRVAFVGSIPKSPSGKILRRELVAQSLSGGSKL